MNRDPVKDDEPQISRASRTLNANDIRVHRSGPTILRALAVVIIVAAVALGVVLIARSIYHHAHHPARTANSGNNTSSKISGSQKSTSGSETANNKSNKSSRPSAEVPDTGPGNVLALFVGASLAAAGLHFIISLRRSTDS